jgi:hypothetical protein
LHERESSFRGAFTEAIEQLHRCDRTENLEAPFTADDRAQLRGNPLATLMIVSEVSTEPASYKAPDAASLYLRPVPDGVLENKATVRSTRWVRMYAPGDLVGPVSSTPLVMLVTDHDYIAVTDLALKSYERALQPKRLVMIKGGHFDPYLAEFEAASRASIDWFRVHIA